MELNREQIIKALECCASDGCEFCPYSRMPTLANCVLFTMGNALSLIKEQEQKIFELENRFKECENGYEGTLYLDRCKLHDAEEKVKELTQANEQLSESYDHLEKTKDELLSERSRLTEENEKLKVNMNAYGLTAKRLAEENEGLRAQNETLEINNKDFKYRIYELSRDNEEWEHENKDLECDNDMLRERITEIKADTVRKMEQILQNRITGKLAYHGWYLKETVFPKIAKEILEGL